MKQKIGINLSMQKILMTSVLFAIGLQYSCSESNNIMGHLILERNKKGFTYLLNRSQNLYDNGQFLEANKLAQQAYDIDPTVEKLAILLGYTHLSLAGMDSFDLAIKLMKGEMEKTTDQKELFLNDETEKGAGDALENLRGLIGLSDAELAELSLENNELDGVKGAPTTGLFKDLPVYLPKTAPDARSSTTSTVFHVNRAIEVICPFISVDAKIIGTQGDVRHTSKICEGSNNDLFESAKAHFLWSIAHLTEAIAFHSIVLYKKTGDSPHLVQRSEALEDPSISADIGLYIEAVGELATVLNIILPTSDELAKNSMLTAMFNDLETASLGFKKLAGIPEAFTSSIDSALDDLNAQKEALSSSTSSESAKNSQVLKDSLTTSLKKNLRSQLSKKDLSNEDEKQELCTQVCLALEGESTPECDCS